jgi:glycerate 2-kinase
MNSGSVSISGNTSVGKFLQRIVENAINAVEPRVLFEKGFRVVGDSLTAFGKEMDLSKFKNIKCVAMGKSAEAMSYELDQRLQGKVTGIIATPVEEHLSLERFRFFKTGHPFPDEVSLDAGTEIREFVSSSSGDDLLIFLISGGGSAAACLPVEGVSLAEMNETLKVLFENAIPINKINLVRRHISSLGGGKLAELSAQTEKVSLIISDVVGDDMPSIASGPTVVDVTMPIDAYNFLNESNLRERIPASISEALSRSKRAFAKINTTRNFVKIIGSNADALKAAAKTGTENGFDTLVLTRSLDLNTLIGADLLASVAMSMKLDRRQMPSLVLLGGETTVKMTGTGIGGRNQQLILETLGKLIHLDAKEKHFDGITFFAFGTDGKDGNSDAAGAFASTQLLKDVPGGTKEIEKNISDNDSNSFFKKYGGLITTGPTDTNVMDIIGIVAE